MQAYSWENRRSEFNNLIQIHPICRKISEFFQNKPHIDWGKITEVARSINGITAIQEAKYILSYLENLSKIHPWVFILFLERIAPHIANQFWKEIIALTAISSTSDKPERLRNSILINLGFEDWNSLHWINERYPREHWEIKTLMTLAWRLIVITLERTRRSISNRPEEEAILAA